MRSNTPKNISYSNSTDMNSAELVESISEFKEVKNIDRPTIMKVLEDVFKTLLKKKYGSDEHFDIIVNTDKGDLEIWRNRTIVEDGEVEEPLEQISITEARLIDPGFDVGDDCYEEITLDSFGRRAILAARQTLISRILDLEKDEIFKKYKDRIGEIITAEVYQIWRKEIMLLDDEGNELILPKTEQIKSDFYKKGDTIRAVVKDVEMRGSNPKVILSRTDPAFLAKLLELEVPEIFDGLITIRRIVREPGERAKVAVESYDDRIDPVGACVGMKGSRIHGIVRELRNENIDIINFTNNPSLLIQRALNPAKISSIQIHEDKKRVSVFLKPDQVSLAIGKGGLNIKLASRLTGYEIDVFRDLDEIEDDVDLDEFIDEIDAWVLDALKGIGCDTAKSVLELDRDEIVRRADLEEETVDEVIRILKEEFDN
jgi:N utilization substance protein A